MKLTVKAAYILFKQILFAYLIFYLFLVSHVKPFQHDLSFVAHGWVVLEEFTGMDFHWEKHLYCISYLNQQDT